MRCEAEWLKQGAERSKHTSRLAKPCESSRSTSNDVASLKGSGVKGLTGTGSTVAGTRSCAVDSCSNERAW